MNNLESIVAKLKIMEQDQFILPTECLKELCLLADTANKASLSVGDYRLASEHIVAFKEKVIPVKAMSLVLGIWYELGYRLDKLKELQSDYQAEYTANLKTSKHMVYLMKPELDAITRLLGGAVKVVLSEVQKDILNQSILSMGDILSRGIGVYHDQLEACNNKLIASKAYSIKPEQIELIQ